MRERTDAQTESMLQDVKPTHAGETAGSATDAEPAVLLQAVRPALLLPCPFCDHEVYHHQNNRGRKFAYHAIDSQHVWCALQGQYIPVEAWQMRAGQPQERSDDEHHRPLDRRAQHE